MRVRGRAGLYERPLVAALYDLDVRLTSRPLWGTSLRDQVRFATDALLDAEGPVLEVPVGTGLVLKRALARRRRATVVVGVDLSRAMLRRAQRRLGTRAALVQADVMHLPFRDGAFAAVHSGNGFHLFPSRHTAAREITRTLQPGGVAAITTWTDQGGRPARIYQRLLVGLGQITPQVSVAEHVRTFRDAGLLERTSQVGGTLLRWVGTRS